MHEDSQVARPSRVLIVDDNATNRAVLRDQMTACGHTPVEAANGLEALALIRRDPPDLLLLDIQMPGISGSELLDVLKRDPLCRDVPVLVISAVDDLDLVASCIARGAEDYLVKPPNPLLLRARVASSLQRHQLVREERQLREQVEAYILEVRSLREAAEAEKARVETERRAASDTSRMVCDELRTLAASIERACGGEWYTTALLHDLAEIETCLQNGCYRALAGLAGRVLELTLKLACVRHGQAFDDSWMVGKLLETLSGAGVALDPGMRNIWNLLNSHRIVSVHARDAAPPPSRQQALMVCHALLETVERTFGAAT